MVVPSQKETTRVADLGMCRFSATWASRNIDDPLTHHLFFNVRPFLGGQHLIKARLPRANPSRPPSTVVYKTISTEKELWPQPALFGVGEGQSAQLFQLPRPNLSFPIQPFA